MKKAAKITLGSRVLRTAHTKRRDGFSLRLYMTSPPGHKTEGDTFNGSV